jgi:putative hydrolase of the HAD superfamily
VAARHERLRASGIAFPEVRIERIWGGLFPGRSDNELRRLAIDYELATHSCWPMPGCRSVIASIADRGVRLGIVSNAQFYTPLFFQAFFARTTKELGFHPSLCVYSYRHRAGKPGPELYELAKKRLSRLGISAPEAVMVGNDLENDVAAARPAGFMTVLVTGDRRMPRVSDGGRTLRARPDAVIDRLSSLDRLIS